MIVSIWNEFSLREKYLVGSAGVLTISLLLLFVIILPQVEAKAEARRSLDRAYQDRALADQTVSAIVQSGLTSGAAAQDEDTFRAEVTKTAQGRGLEITRLQNGEEGSLLFVFSDSSPIDIFGWLQDISGLPGGQVLTATMTGREGRVEAVIELQGTQP